METATNSQNLKSCGIGWLGAELRDHIAEAVIDQSWNEAQHHAANEAIARDIARLFHGQLKDGLKSLLVEAESHRWHAENNLIQRPRKQAQFIFWGHDATSGCQPENQKVIFRSMRFAQASK